MTLLYLITLHQMQNSHTLYVIMQLILMAVYAFVGIRSLSLALKMKGKSWLTGKRRDLLFMIVGTCGLFILAEACMLLEVEELFIWFFFDLSLAFVYHTFYSVVSKDNSHGHK